VCEKVAAAANFGHTQLIQSLSLGCLRGRGAQVLHIILASLLAILLDLLQISQILAPDDVVAADTANREYHFERYT